MPAPAKLLHVLGLLAKAEATYGTYLAPSTTADGVQLQYPSANVPMVMDINYTFDGSLGPSVGNLGTVVRVAPAGRFVKGDLPTRARPGGAAYSAVVIPSIHQLLKQSGFDATVTTTTAAEKWVYTPTAPGTGYGSSSMNIYTRGELYALMGVLSDLKVEFSDPKPPIWTFMSQGILNAIPTDVAAPVITYPLQTVAPPLASAIALTLGNLTSANANVMSGSLTLGRKLTPRVVLSGGSAHLGFVPGERVVQLKVVLESTALTGTTGTAAATFDPYNLQDLALQVAVALKFGTTPYNRYTINLPQAQVMNAVPVGNGPVATVELTIAAACSTAVSADDINITFD